MVQNISYGHINVLIKTDADIYISQTKEGITELRVVPCILIGKKYIILFCTIISGPSGPKVIASAAWQSLGIRANAPQATAIPSLLKAIISGPCHKVIASAAQLSVGIRADTPPAPRS